MNVLKLPRNIKVWEPASGGGNIAKVLSEDYGYDVLETDIESGFDFLKEDAPFEFNCIITNPPFSLKDKFLKKCYDLWLTKHTPFALLLPINALGAQLRQDLYRTYGVEIVMLGRRVHFKPPNKEKGSSPQQEHAWFTWGFHIGKQITFYNLPKELDGSAEFSERKRKCRTKT